MVLQQYTRSMSNTETYTTTKSNLEEKQWQTLNGREKKKLELLTTTKRTNALLGLDWMKHLGINLNIEKLDAKIQNIQEDPAHRWLEEKIQKKPPRKQNSRRKRSRHSFKTRRKADTAKRPTDTDSLTTGSR